MFRDRTADMAAPRRKSLGGKERSRSAHEQSSLDRPRPTSRKQTYSDRMDWGSKTWLLKVTATLRISRATRRPIVETTKSETEVMKSCMQRVRKPTQPLDIVNHTHSSLTFAGLVQIFEARSSRVLSSTGSEKAKQEGQSRSTFPPI